MRARGLDPQAALMSSIGDGMALANINVPDNLAEFCEGLRLQIDGRPFDLERYSYLDMIYREVVTRENLLGGDFKLVLMFGAQTGKTALMATMMTYLALMLPQSSWGYYFPTQLLSQFFSNERFKRIVESNQNLIRYYKNDDFMERKQNVTVRHFGLSTLYFLWVSGKVTTESIPMWGVFFDEVRRMAQGDIERAEKRITASPFKINIKVSTAGFPESDIDAAFRRSDQHYWHSRCKCQDGVVLALTFPDCIHQSRGRLRYRCPDCKTRIDDPRDGQFFSHNPDSPIWGFQIPQMLSPDVPVEKIWDEHLTMRDRQEFWNSVVGIPWVSSDTQPLNRDVYLACVNKKVEWEASSDGGYNYMGVDQRGGENHIIIVKKKPGEKPRITHIEIIQGDDPFLRLYALMAEFNIACCVVDQNPNYNEALRFAKAHMGRVFLCTYHDVAEIIRWGDRVKKPESVRKTKYEAQFDQTVRADRYKTIDTLLARFVSRDIELPPPQDLVQNVFHNGQLLPLEVALGSSDTKEPGLLLHLMSVARVKTPIYKTGPNGQQLDTGDIRMDWQNLRGIDPHWLHALNYCIIASDRRGESVILTTETPVEDGDKQINEVTSMIKMQAGVVDSRKTQREDTCQDCTEFKPDQNPNCPIIRANTKSNAKPCVDGFNPKRPGGDDKKGEAGGYFIV